MTASTKRGRSKIQPLLILWNSTTLFGLKLERFTLSFAFPPPCSPENITESNSLEDALKMHGERFVLIVNAQGGCGQKVVDFVMTCRLNESKGLSYLNPTQQCVKHIPKTCKPP